MIKSYNKETGITTWGLTTWYEKAAFIIGAFAIIWVVFWFSVGFFGALFSEF